MHYRLAAIDLDETILAFDGSISERNRVAVLSLQEAGILPVIASGRMHEATVRFADLLNLPGPIISYNGAMIRTRADGALWHHRPLPSYPAARIVEYCETRGLHLNYYLEDHLYVHEPGRWAEFYVRHTGSPIEPIGDLRQLDGRAPTKLILIDEPDRIIGYQGELDPVFSQDLYITRTNPEYLEFMHPHANKGTALAILAARLGIDRSEVLAFGDGANDLPMLQWAGLSIAMGNGRQEVRDVASVVAPPFDRDGFAVAVEGILADGSSGPDRVWLDEGRIG